MTLLPIGLGRAELLAWRLDQATFAPTWDSGEGAFRVGGRWNGRGTRAVYCALDPATAILEVAVHKGFRTLDVVPHILTAAEVLDRDAIHIIQPKDLPNRDWLVPGLPHPAQQAFGDDLLRRYQFIAVPSAVSPHSWNLVFAATQANGSYAVRQQEPFVLDPRLHANKGG